MKLLFSYLILLGFNAKTSAKLITISYEEGEETSAQEIKKYFVSNYAVPSKLISLLHKEECELGIEKYFELCIDKKKALNLVSAKDIVLIRKSILSFSNQREVRNEF